MATGTPSKVFADPLILSGPAHSQFGAAISRAGDLNEDGYEDFVVGAPFANDGQGAIYLFHGAESVEKMDNTSVQTIAAEQIQKGLTSFGWALNGGRDVDKNDYDDLLVGAFGSNKAVLLRTRPIMHVAIASDPTTVALGVDKDESCADDSAAQTCFDVKTVLSVKKSRVPIDSDLFLCHLAVEPVQQGAALRAQFAARDEKNIHVQWPCGSNADDRPQTRSTKVFIPKNVRDWLRPLKFHAWVELRDKRAPRQSPGGPLTSLDAFPVLDLKTATHTFHVPFNKKCGADNHCETDLELKCSFGNLA